MRALGLVAILGLVLVAAACGGNTPEPVASPSTSESAAASPTPPPAGASQLTIVVDDGTGATTTWTLTCDPPGGTHPDPAGACQSLTEHPSALRPVPKDKMCAQVYGGPERATVRGTWDGEQVLASLSRTNACETARWDSLVPLVPSGGR
ncbi:MAG TPA: SSI family serine proteinase inhibitor [Microlunatus sp.]|nr:SSI family serine proteinase inhibitor [Microlunatus sp.]